MNKTTRIFLLGLPLAISAGLYAGHVATPPIVNEVAPIQEILPIPADRGDTVPKGTTIDFWEDGSGVKYDADGNEIATYPEGTFPWDCRTMGNRICG